MENHFCEYDETKDKIYCPYCGKKKEEVIVVKETKAEAN
jgi:rubredoxin